MLRALLRISFSQNLASYRKLSTLLAGARHDCCNRGTFRSKPVLDLFVE